MAPFDWSLRTIGTYLVIVVRVMKDSDNHHTGQYNSDERDMYLVAVICVTHLQI